MLALALLLASTASADAAVRIVARPVRVEGGAIQMAPDDPPPPRPRARACSPRDPAPPGCRLIVWDLP